MSWRRDEKIWSVRGMTRRGFLRHFGIAGGALTVSPFFLSRLERALADPPTVKVYKVLNGDCFQNTAKIWELLGGVAQYINPTDVVVIKCNGQWAHQGYTHTGCIKGVIDKILELPGFAGEIHICDNVQVFGSIGSFGFDAGPTRRNHNWPDHNWTTLATEYQGAGKPVAVKRWYNSDLTIAGPADGEGYIRDFFTYDTRDTYLSYPVYESPLTPGRMVDTKNGVWEGGAYTGRQVKTIFMPTLNNHGLGAEDYAGVTSAIKCFLGISEIKDGAGVTYLDHKNIHGSSYRGAGEASRVGGLAARYINHLVAPSLYITAAMWSGHYSRTDAATETKTVLACENPATLDYVACRDVISPYASWLDPDQNNNTRAAILGCINGGLISGQSNPGVGTIAPGEYEIITYDFNNPTVNRLDIDRAIRDHKAGLITEQDVKNSIQQYME